MQRKMKINYWLIAWVLMGMYGCIPQLDTVAHQAHTPPTQYMLSKDSAAFTPPSWKQYFDDPLLIDLIDTALVHNQELNILLQEIEISRNEIRARKGEYLPSVNLGIDGGIEKNGQYTRNGAVEEELEIDHGKSFPEPLGDIHLALEATWEIDAWKKMRNAKQAAVKRYLATQEGKNFMVTQLIAEISTTYFELMALDNQMEIIKQNIELQTNVLRIVEQQKAAAKVSQLAVNRFKAQLLHTQNRQYEIKQAIVEHENRINALLGRYHQPIHRNSSVFMQLSPDSTSVGLPSQLLANRPDVRQAELEIEACALDLTSARAQFYPRLAINSAIGLQAFDPTYLIKPQSLLYNLAGELIAPLVNRNAIKSAYYSANARQIQAVYNYEQTLVNAYVDVLNQIAKLDNYSRSYSTKFNEVELLIESVSIANNLFNSARADYGEVLFTQREALDSKMELIEIKLKQLEGKVAIYRALGGGWQ